MVDALLERFSGDGLSYVQLLRGEGAPEDGELVERIAARGLEPDVSWAASRTIRSSSRRSEPDGDAVLLVEDNEVYRSSLELLLGLQPGSRS